MTDDPDFSLEYLEDLCTFDQLAQVKCLERFGWRVTHLWERLPGEICPWLLVRRPTTELKKSGYLHCYILPDGTMRRYEATLRNELL